MAFLLFLFLKLLLWDVLSVNPMYVSTLLLSGLGHSCLVYDAWRLALSNECPSSRHVYFMRQLQLLAPLSVLFSLVIIALMWFEKICFIFGIQL